MRPAITVQGDEIIVLDDEDNLLTFRKTMLPEVFLKWQSVSRVRLFDAITVNGVQSIKSQPSHLPVIATTDDSVFGVNLSTKGIGVLPRRDILDEVTKGFMDAINLSDESEWQNTIMERTATALRFYNDASKFDQYLLGGLEIFEGNTYKNILENPFTALLYTGAAPDFPSYQINCVAEILTPENPYYQFLYAARNLFAYDSFHIKQTRYPAGYLFHVSEVKNKTPHPRK